MDDSVTCIDLFAGCGGFSLGLHKAGLKTLAAIDFDPKAIEVYRANMGDHVPHVLCEDLTKFAPADLAKLIGTSRVDVIAGGPPCQGFSQVRQRDGANNGERLIHDPRRTLYQQYFEYVAHFQPKLFVMENVLGIRSADGGRHFRDVKESARRLGYRVYGEIVEATTFGVPQKRRRQLIIGTRIDYPGCFRRGLIVPVVKLEGIALGHAIMDLPVLKAGGGTDPCEYKQPPPLRKKHLRLGEKYRNEVLEIKQSKQLTAHVARPHSERDLRDFAKLKEGETAKQAIDRGVEMEFPYDRGSFSDRYTRQSRAELCSTIVAHLSKDGLMFIHPTQNRSLTPREAARIQSFPDWFQFPIARTHQFRVIGNAVPPLIARAVGQAVKKFLKESEMTEHRIEWSISPLPESDEMALEWLTPLLDLDAKTLRQIPLDKFKKAWYAIGFLYAGLHPDETADHGSEVSSVCNGEPNCDDMDPRLSAPYYVQSGWPLILEPIADEAWRRNELGGFKEEEIYCFEAAMAGMCHRDPLLAEQARIEREELESELRLIAEGNRNCGV